MKLEDKIYNLQTKYNITESDKQELVRLSNILKLKRKLEDISNAADIYLKGFEEEVNSLRKIIMDDELDSFSEYLYGDLFSWGDTLIHLKRIMDDYDYDLLWEDEAKLLEEVEGK